MDIWEGARTGGTAKRHAKEQQKMAGPDPWDAKARGCGLLAAYGQTLISIETR